ncbi:hypothetical protein [Aridibaculum aurantiacum]|uniref:hypothetical protein n=1 Tax=Aridibaculum aurantiacum TaxID=2810307 RepID=UPI001A96151F|nr:hypothetical protein [Aridibaculum aurantiacum]
MSILATMKYALQFLILATLSIPAIAQDTTSGKTVRIGNTKVQIITSCFIPCNNGILFLNVHENEKTSVNAATEFMNNYGGKMIRLKHSGERNISFYIGKSRFFFDPNRIYSNKGIQATLKKLSYYTPESYKQVQAFSREILKPLQNQKLLIALHNNTDENYSIKNYQEGGDEENNAKEVYVNPEMDTDDFIITTDSSIYRRIVEKNINVVLQDNKRVADDGSLSVYAAKNNIPYLNIEAQEGHYKEQLAMLEAIEDIIKDYRSK